MPSSPAMRCSPGREIRGDNHKRGRSLEGEILLREKDDDLALFNDMQTRERDSFLLQSNDDFEDTFSTKLRYFSDYKLGISIPARGESSDLLNADGEKNDYDWLLTPPETPLFPSLDDEMPPTTLAQRGRPQSQPITISRSSTMEKSCKNSKGSASPNRLSPSPRSGNSTSQMRGRPSSASHLSPTPGLRHATPLRIPSPPPNKPSTPAPRSSTPTHRRMSTGSSGTVPSFEGRGTSPVKTSRGNSASPKIRAWQTNIPGFSLDAPPNLRTSLTDRPTSYVSGSSPGSRNVRDSSSRSGRQSLSPTATRSVSSSHCHEREQISSHSKGSAAASCDDDVDSLQSIPMSSSNRSASRRVGAFPSNRAPSFSKMPTKTMLSSSAPKRSFDSALREMDHRKVPQYMFRPLLSSVPSSTFYVGKTSAAHHALISRNSSVTTSSNASSDQGTSGAHDTEGSDQNQDDVTTEWGKAPYLDQDDVFEFEKEDAINENISDGVHDGPSNVQHGHFSGGASQLGDSENFDYRITATPIPATSECLQVKANFPELDSVEDMALCSRCGRRYHAIELTEGDLKLCQDCKSSDEPLAATNPVPTLIGSENQPSESMKISGEDKSFDEMKPVIAVPESSEVTNMVEAMATQHEENVQGSQSFYAETSLNILSENSLAQTLAQEDMRMPANQQGIGQSAVGYNPSNGDTGAQQMQYLSDHPNLKLDVSEGTGISILLKRSSSGKGPVVQGRTFTAISIPYDDRSYVRDGATSMRTSLGQGSASASSSVDLGSARQIETRVQRQLSGRKSDIETHRYDTNTNQDRTGSPLSGTPSHAFQGLGLATSTHEEKMGVAVAHVEDVVENVTDTTTQEQMLVSESAGVDDSCTEVECNNGCGTIIVSPSESLTHPLKLHLGDSSVASFSDVEDSASYGNGEDFQNDARSISDREASAVTPDPSTVEEDTMPNSSVDRMDVLDVPTQSLLDTMSKKEIENADLGSPGSQSDVVSTDLESGGDELLERSIATTSDKDITASIAEPDTLNHAHGILEESTVTVESHGGARARSLTMEEAADTILFCSSIVHNLAYEAATLAMEKENLVPQEGSGLSVTILGNSNSDVRDRRSRTAAKRTSKTQKTRQRPGETDTKPPSGNPNSDENVDASTTRIVGVPDKSDNMKPQKLESKCNCTVM